MALEGLLEPLVEEQTERDIEADDDRDRGRERRIERLLRVPRRAPSRSSSADARASSTAAQASAETETVARPGRRHQRLLRARDHRVEAPGVGLERNGAEARDGVDDDERACLLGGGGEALDVCDHAGRGLRVRHEDDLGAAELAQPRARSSAEGASPHS